MNSSNKGSKVQFIENISKMFSAKYCTFGYCEAQKVIACLINQIFTRQFPYLCPAFFLNRFIHLTRIYSSRLKRKIILIGRSFYDKIWILTARLSELFHSRVIWIFRYDQSCSKYCKRERCATSSRIFDFRKNNPRNYSKSWLRQSWSLNIWREFVSVFPVLSRHWHLKLNRVFCIGR